MTRTTARRRLRTATMVSAVVWGAATLLGGLGATTASAHDYLVSSSPADGSTVTSAPGSVTLTFNDVVLSTPGGTSTAVLVTGPDKDESHHEVSAPQVSGRDVVTDVSLQGPGTYTVQWRIVSADGHPVEGSLSFRYRPSKTASASPTTDTREPGSVTPSTSSGDDGTPTTGGHPAGGSDGSQTPGGQATDDGGSDQGTGDGTTGDGADGTTTDGTTTDGSGDAATDGATADGTDQSTPAGPQAHAATTAAAQGSGSSTGTVVAVVVLVLLVGGGVGAWLVNRSRRRADASDDEHSGAPE
jgi:methionine-rich copper-binding protein CopC